jgi:hypothetical protein
MSRVEWIKRELRKKLVSEAEAKLMSERVRHEIMDNGGPDIGSRDETARAAYDAYLENPSSTAYDAAIQQIVVHKLNDPDDYHIRTYTPGLARRWDVNYAGRDGRYPAETELGDEVNELIALSPTLTEEIRERLARGGEIRLQSEADTLFPQHSIIVPEIYSDARLRVYFLAGGTAPVVGVASPEQQYGVVPARDVWVDGVGGEFLGAVADRMLHMAKVRKEIWNSSNRTVDIFDIDLVDTDDVQPNRYGEVELYEQTLVDPEDGGWTYERARAELVESMIADPSGIPYYDDVID